MIKVKDGYAKLIGTTYQGSATQVLLSNGGNLEFSSTTKANTLVQRNASQHIYATYFNSAISDEALTDIGSVYVRNTSDTFIRRISKTQFYSIIDNKFVTLDTAQNITGVKTFSSGLIATDIVANKFKTLSGTSSQFLKADGSVDGNLYALAYKGNQNEVQYSRHTDYLKTVDRRNQVYTPNIIENSSLSSYFTIQDTPYANWRSTISVKGWSSDYATWELTGPSHNNDTIKNERPYFRYGFNTNWEPWRAIAFLDDVKNVANIYFNGQDIYSDYGHWVVGLIRIGTADIGNKYISGEMIYRRSNGIYANGSVRFNLIKKYNSTQMFAGVFYTGYGVDPDQDAPRLCTFTYQGVKWGGLCWRSAASLNSIKTIIYDNSSTDTPFYVRYYNSQSGKVQNTEINNSISVLGSDIDIQPVSTNGRFYTSADRIEINNITNGWSYIRYRTNGIFYDVGLSGTTAGMAGAGNFEIRPNGSNNEGVFVRYYQSDYGKLGVVNKSGQQCSISYFNNAPTGDYPLWTVGAGIRNQYSFDWRYHNQGYKMTLDSEGKLFINVKGQGNPSCSLAIGDYDTGLNWRQDGMIVFKSNNKDVGHWNYSEGRLYNTYFREPTGNVYTATAMMVNGNGSNLYPGIGFHQPGITAGVVYFTNSGEFKFRNINDNGYTNVYGGNLIADAGFLYSRYNGIEIKIGAENDSYVHFITKPARSLYFANSLFVNGSVLPYVTNTHDLGDAGHTWRNAYIGKVLGGANWAEYISNHYVGGRQFNPQTYFGNSGIGLKVAMTGVYTNGAYWSDTIWINGYHGTDVPSCNALHFPRDGSSEMYISSQTYNATSYGSVYRFWSSKNSNKSDAAWTCSTLNASGRIYCADVYSNSWLRTVGQTGWYSESYGGGWYMTDATYIRAYGSKRVYTANTEQHAFYTAGGMTAAKGFWHSAVNSNSYVLLAGGSYKNLADFVKGNAGASNRGVYVTNGTVTAMTYYLNATVNSGASGKLAYYSGTNSIDDYTNTIGSSSTPIYINNGIPKAANSYKVVNSGHYFSAFGISGYIYVIRYGQVVCVSINMSSGGNGSTGTTTLLTNLPSAVYTTGQSASKGGGSALRQATFYVSGTTLYVYSSQANQLPNKVSFTYITNTLE